MRANALFAMTHPCYVGGGYECRCGVFSKTSEEHRNHVYSTHDKEFAKEVLPESEYMKFYDYESYERIYLTHRKNVKEFKSYMKKQNCVNHKFLGWYNKFLERYLTENEVIEIRKKFNL